MALSLLEITRVQYYCPENLRCNLKFYESENFSASSFHRIFESGNFWFPFSVKNSLIRGSEIQKLNFGKNSSFENCSCTVVEWNGHLVILRLHQGILRNFCFCEQIFYRKQPLGAPDYIGFQKLYMKGTAI